MGTSQVEIISSAFVKLGEYPINATTFNLGNPLHAAAKQTYEHLLPFILSKYPWRFAIEHQELSLLTNSPPMNEWQYAFQLPTKPPMIWLYRVYPTSTSYLIFEKKLYANINDISCDYVYQPTEDKFPVYFTELMIDQVAAQIAFTMTKNFNAAAAFKKQAQRSLIDAMTLDAQQHTNTTVVNDPIYEAHFSSDAFSG